MEEYYNATDIEDNATVYVFQNDTKYDEHHDQESLEKTVKLILSLTCIIAVIVNLKVFTSIHWIRRPFNSILKMSLSLAFADSCASCISGVLIFFNFSNRCYHILEMIRLTFILVTVFHLLGLAFNHYIGIKKPLSHNWTFSSKKIALMLILIWAIPSIFILTLYTAEGGFSFWNNLYVDELTYNSTKFIYTFRFRMVFSSFIITSMIFIVLCYLCILMMIEKQRKVWKALSRNGSSVWRGTKTKIVKKYRSHEQSRIKRNFRAVYTTLIILGSCFIGWMPALLIYVVFCREGCYVSGELLDDINKNFRSYIIVLRLFDNEMLFLKMIVNPIIYSVRIKEIKDGTQLMHDQFSRYICYKSRRNNPSSRSFVNSATTHVRMASLTLARTNKDHILLGQRDCQSSFV